MALESPEGSGASQSSQFVACEQKGGIVMGVGVGLKGVEVLRDGEFRRALGRRQKAWRLDCCALEWVCGIDATGEC